jgi:ABC-type multidrug transport system ATPase subunit
VGYDRRHRSGSADAAGDGKCTGIPDAYRERGAKKMNSYLQISGLTKRYGATRALENIHLSIERGSVLALLGPNGAGKSTLFSCLLGLIAPNSGEIQRNGKPIADTVRAGFGYVAERVSLYPQRTVAENAVFFLRLKGRPIADVEHQLERVGLWHARDRKARQLSKGMLQRLGLAIALCGQPELLVLDEPFNGLDPALLDTLQTILREENDRGATLLISTHTMSAVEPLATHVAILLQGRLATFGMLKELRAEHPEADSLETIYHRIARQQHVAEETVA